MTAPVHFIELHADRGEIAPRLVCTATPDAPCRRRPVDPDVESWTDDTETTSGHECWAVEWVDAGGWDSLTWGPESGTLARVPVDVSYDHRGVLVEPVVLPDPLDLLPMTPDGTNPTPRVGETLPATMAEVPFAWVLIDADGIAWQVREDDDGVHIESTLHKHEHHRYEANSWANWIEDFAPITVLFRPDAPEPAPVPDDAVERAALTHARAFVPDVQEVINDDAGDDPDPQWVYDRLVESLAVIDSLADVIEGEYAGAEPATEVGMIVGRALGAARAGEAETDAFLSGWCPVHGQRARIVTAQQREAKCTCEYVAAQRGGEAVDREALEALADQWAGYGDEGAGACADDLRALLAARGGTAPTEVEWGADAGMAEHAEEMHRRRAAGKRAARRDGDA
jgi:hypothetical protein